MTLELFKENIQDSFVENYDLYSRAIGQVNEFFIKVNIPHKYEYNTFCSEFLEEACELYELGALNSMNDVTLFVASILVSIVNKKKEEYLPKNIEDEKV